MSEHNPCEDDAAIQDLIQKALEEIKQDEWNEVSALRILRDCANRKVFEAVKQLCQSKNPEERTLGADILGQFGNVSVDESGIPDLERVFTEEITEVLLETLDKEQAPEVLNAIGVALGHMMEPRGVEPLSRLKSHADESVRFGVVFGLLGQENSLAIQTLIELSQDSDELVRDWATFGLGSIIEEIDTPEIRAALWRNVDDPDEATRYEAIEGLVIRRDKGIIPLVINELAIGIVKVNCNVGESFCNLLHELKDEIQDERLPGILEEYRRVYPDADADSK